MKGACHAFDSASSPSSMIVSVSAFNVGCVTSVSAITSNLVRLAIKVCLVSDRATLLVNKDTQLGNSRSTSNGSPRSVQVDPALKTSVYRVMVEATLNT